MVIATTLGLGLIGCSADSNEIPEGEGFLNPVAPTGNDPYVINDGDGYLAIESKKGGLWVTRSEPKNLTGVFHSSDTKQIWSPPAIGENCADVWAPELHLLDDYWYVYYAATTCDGDNDNHRMFVLKSESSDPMGSYEDLGAVVMSEDHWAIDGTVIELEGNRYFVWSGWPGDQDGQQNLYIGAMSDPVTVTGDRVLLSEPTEQWERNAMPIQEGPQILTKDESVHIIYSASGSWTDDYAYGSLTYQGGEVLDPGNWIKSADALFVKTQNVTGAGHGSFVKSPDSTEDWMVYHASRSVGSGWDRVLMMQPFTWDGTTPVFGEPVDPDEPLRLPAGEVRD